LLSRRDVKTASDQIKIMIDSYHDLRTGYEFAVNPAGVKRDYYTYNDADEDESWDGVWDVATRIDSLGWTAEFRIPLSQLRYPSEAENTFGIMIDRDVARFSERYSWPLYSRTRPGIASQFAQVPGFKGLAAPHRLEISPYTVARTSNAPAGAGYQQRTLGTVGADIKYGLTSNLTLDGTVNPDFGQVEADPSVLNLSAFETFFPEKRPFFIEGQNLFRFDVNCNDGVCSGLFYSRRIGRAPQLSDTYPGDENPAQTTILGAAKLTGRLASGASVGVLDAVTQRAEGPAGATIEPQSNYFVARLQQDFRNGASGIGAMVTSVHRDLDPFTAPYLRRDALAGGIVIRNQFLDRRYSIDGYVAASRVAGSAQAISLTQQSQVHDYQRPDGGVAFDSARTTLGGSSAQISFSKLGGGITRFNVGYQYLSPGFEINDVGFLAQANQQNQFSWFQLAFTTPTRWYRSLRVNFNQWSNFSAVGMREDVGGNVNFNLTLPDNWFVNGGQGVDNAVASYCATCARGGPAVAQSPSLWGWAGVQGDGRNAIVPALFANWGHGDEGRSSNLSLNPDVSLRVASRFSTDVGLNWSHNVAAAQWYGNFGAVGSDTTHYTFARLDQQLVSVTTRLNFTATPNLSLQVYAEPFVTSGAYTNWVELADPRAGRFAGRYRPFSLPGGLSGFNYKQLRSNTVIRWEYRPGSVVYLVWSQNREQDGLDPGTFQFGRDYRNLFRAHPGNTFLIKGSYWLNF
ncbi:MAG: carbohydrate binding family 9 domain-containing protein, partial [Gemmatimonadota bacterium]|nr:carbohydrate binding family 9 domain-containing protein [Gemmatimonadota bacterium]